MDTSPWPPHKKLNSHLSCRLPQSSFILPPSPDEECFNNCRVGNSPSMLLSSSQRLEQLNGADQAAAEEFPRLPNTHYEPLLTPPMHPSKETSDFFCETLYNGVCKENHSAIQNFLHTPGNLSHGESIGFPCSENSVSGYGGQVPPAFHPSAIDRPSPGPFGVLPHEAVMGRSNRFERSNDKFMLPVSKTVTASYNSGPYADRDVNSIYSSAPLSAQSVFSGDNASLSPIVNSVTSPTISNFSSPSDYYSSPKPNFGAYNSLQSPVPQSPSVAQHSYPSSPFTNVEAVGHVPTAPPCSPMGGNTYVNNLNQVPQRNGLKSQHSPSSSVGSNSVMCYNTPQSQNMVHHGSVLPKTPDYHSEYGAYMHDHNVSPSSFSSVYPAMHPGQMTMGNNSRISPRSHSQHLNSMTHDSLISTYGHPPPIQQPAMSSPTYLQNKLSHEAPYGPCSSSSISPGQSMHLSRYPSCSTPINSMRSNTMHQTLSPVMTSHMSNDRQFGYQPSGMVNEKTALDMFNTHVDSGVHNPDNSTAITNLLDSDLRILGSEMLSNRQLQSSERAELHQNRSVNTNNPNRVMGSHPQMLNAPHNSEAQLNMDFFNSSQDVVRPGNFSYNSYPRKRGRRGRRRKAAEIHHNDSSSRFESFKNNHTVYNNGYSIEPSKSLEYENVDCYTNTNSKRMCDMKELPPANYSFSRYRSELKMRENQKKNSSSEFDHSDKPKTQKKIWVSVEEELKFLGDLDFSDEEDEGVPHTFMKTRNKDTEGFFQCYKNFLANKISRSEPASYPLIKPENIKKEPDDEESQRSPKPKLIIRMGKCNTDEWKLKDTLIPPELISVKLSDSDESASADSVDVLSSHIIKQKEGTAEKSKVRKTGNSSKVSERLSKHSAKRKRDSVDHSDKYNDLKENNLPFTNSETLPAGIKIKTEIIDDDEPLPSPPCNEPEPNFQPKKRGRKAKNATVQAQPKKITRQSSAKTSEPIFDFTAVTIKQELIDEEEVKYECTRLSTLRSRRDNNSLKDQPGPSIKKEPIDISSDEIETIDDSDSDPAWTPSSKSPRASDPLRLFRSQGESTAKRRRKRGGRRGSLGAAGPAGRKKRANASETGRKRACSEKPRASTRKNSTKEKLCAPDIKIKKERVPEHFVIAKADVANEDPPIWRVDRDTNMLQRFEMFEKDGLKLHRNTYTFVGPETDEVPLQCPDSTKDDPDAPKRENFEVFLQSLISQALDPAFLLEIANENVRGKRRRSQRIRDFKKIQDRFQDEYFLSHIKEIERVTDKKKKMLVKGTWDEELKKSADTFPCVNILDSNTDDVKCQVCHFVKGLKLLQFYGQPYDYTNLGSVDTPLSIKAHFNVCSACSSTVSLYNRLHHHKYNYFIECRTKLNQVKGENESISSHSLLDNCLQDHQWVNSLFEQLEKIWKECDRNS